MKPTLPLLHPGTEVCVNRERFIVSEIDNSGRSPMLVLLRPKLTELISYIALSHFAVNLKKDEVFLGYDERECHTGIYTKDNNPPKFEQARTPIEFALQ